MTLAELYEELPDQSSGRKFFRKIFEIINPPPTVASTASSVGLQINQEKMD